MYKNKTKKKDFKIYCCFSNNENDVEKTIGLIFIDYVKEKIKEKDKKIS